MGKSGSKRKAAESIQEEDDERMIPELSLHARNKNRTNKVTPIGSAVAKMPMLKPRIRSIPSGVIASKWAPMSEKARDEVYNVLKSVERPVLMTFKKENQKARAQEVLRELMQKYDGIFFWQWGLGMFICNMANLIVGRLVLLLQVPVPPMGRDMAFSYERLIDKNVSWYLGTWFSSLILTRTSTDSLQAGT